MFSPTRDAARLRRPVRPQLLLAIVLLAISLALAYGSAQAAGGSGAIWGRVSYVGGIPGDHPILVCAHTGTYAPVCPSAAEGGAYVLDELTNAEYSVRALVNVHSDDLADWSGAAEGWYDVDDDGQPDAVAVSGGSVSGIDIIVGGPWVTLAGPQVVGGVVTALAVDAANPEVVYAAVRASYGGGNGRVFASADAGVTWTAIYTPPLAIYDLAARGDRICATGYRDGEVRLMCSADGGASWETVDDIVPDHAVRIYDLAIGAAPSRPIVLAGHVMSITASGTLTDGLAIVLRSSDGGGSWERLLERPAPLDNAGFYAIAQDPSTPGSYLAAALEGDAVPVGFGWKTIYAVEDDDWAGATRIYSGTAPASFRSLAVDPDDGDVILAGDLYEVVRSADGGGSWNPVWTDAGLHVALPGAGRAYATSSDGVVYASADRGALTTWNAGVPVDDRVDGFAAANSLDLYVGGPSGVSRSIDGGVTWALSNSGITARLVARRIVVNPFDPDYILVAAGTDGGWISDDGGATWARDTAERVETYAFHPWHPGVVYRGVGSEEHGTIARSTDGGAHWETVYTPTMDYVEPPSLGRISAIAPAPSRPTTVFAGGADYPGMASPHATLVRSTQDGAPGSWVEVLRMSSISFVDAIAVHPTNPDIVYASVSGQHRTAPYASWSAIRRTVDGGATWVEVFTGTVEISSLAIDRVDPDIVYAATAAQQLYRSVDGGNIWTVVRPSPAEGGGPSGQQVLADARVGGRVYLAGPEAVLESADGGDTWVQIGGPFMPISGSSPLSLVVADHGVHQTLYRGSEGVWTFTRRAHLDRRLYIPTAIAVSP